jgi:hypothetical protein
MDVLISASALYARGDPYESSDAVFGVKDSLIVDYTTADKDTAQKYGVQEGTLLMTYDFVLVSDREASELRDEKSRDALQGLGWTVKFLEGLPIPDLD